MPVKSRRFGITRLFPHGLSRPALRALAAAIAVAALVACADLPVEPDAASPTASDPATPTATAAAGPPAGPEAAPAAPAPESPPPAAAFPPGVLYKLLVAEFAGRRGEVALAVENYLDAARETRDPKIAERAARIAVFARDEARSVVASELWVDIAPDALDARRVNAVLLLRAGQIDRAVTGLERIVTGWNEPPGRGFGIVSNMLSRERDRDAALAAMKRVVANRADDVNAQFALAQLTTRFGKLDESVEVLERALRNHPEDPRLIVFYARVLRTQDRMEPALEFLRDAVDRLPEAHQVRMTYARLLVDANRYEDARSEFQHLVEVQPDDPNVRFALGLLLLQVEERAPAREQFERLLALGKRRLSAHYYLGQIAEADEDLEGAVASYRKVDRGDHYLTAQVRIASIYAERGDVEKGRAHLHGIQRSSAADDIRVYRAEAELLVRADRHEDAIRVYDLALEQHPQDGDLLYGRAMVAARVDRIDILERDLRDILSREPDNADALNALGYTLADRTDRYEEAMQLVKRAFELKPNDHYIMDSMGWILYRLGRYEEAETHLRNAMSIREDAEIAAHLGEVLWALGRRDEARQVWEAALEQAPDDERLLETIKRFDSE